MMVLIKILKMKTRIISILVSLFLLNLGCSDLEKVNFIEIKTFPAEDITLISASLSGEIKGIEALPVEQHGFVWSSETEAPTFVINDGKIELGLIESNASFSAMINNLENKQTYFARSFALSGTEEYYGESISFMTNDIQLTTDSLVYEKRRAANVYGTLIGINSNASISQLGVVWSATNEEPRIDGPSPDAFMELGEPSMDGVFMGEISNLENNTRYFYRTYAILDFGNEIIYGNTQSWDTDLGDIWTRKSDMPIIGAKSFGFVINDKGYIGWPFQIFEYDFTLDEWTTKSSFNAPLPDDLAAFSVGDNIYFIGGVTDTEISSKVYRYNTVNDEWTIMPDFPGGPRFLPIGFSIGDTGYFGLGYSGSPVLDFLETDIWKFDETNGWEELPMTNPDFPGTNLYFDIRAYSDGQRGYIAGDGTSGIFWLYEPQTNTWIRKNDFVGGVTKTMAGFHINNTLYLGTGFTQGQVNTKGLWRYNIVDDTWTEMADLDGVPRRAAMSFSRGNKGYIIGGFTDESPGVGKDIWEYTPIDD